MAELNFDENNLDKDSALYKLYSQYYQGMLSANQTIPPNFSTPPTTPDGSVDVDLINKTLDEYSTVLMKNSAYLFASTISGVYSGSGGDGELGNFVKKSGDSMLGHLNALHGVSIGKDGVKFIETTGNEEDTYLLSIVQNVDITGTLNVENIIFKNLAEISYSDLKDIKIDADTMRLSNNLEVGGNVIVGDIKINYNKILLNDVFEFFNESNANLPSVDWQAKNMAVNGQLSISNNANVSGVLFAHSFALGLRLEDGDDYMLYSKVYDNGEKYISLNSDLSINAGFGIKFLDNYVLNVRQGVENIVSLSASNMTLNLGDNGTADISLQTDIKNFNKAYTLVSKNGDGYFPNSFKAGCNNSSGTVLETYSAQDSQGVWFKKNIKIGHETLGPLIYSDSKKYSLNTKITYIRVDSEENRYEEKIDVSLYNKQTTSLLKSSDKEWSATLHIDSDAEFISFDKPVESSVFAINSERYKTHLSENVLFFNDGVFLEGVSDGIRYAGNAYFDKSIGSRNFASGFAGYGWSIRENELHGGVSATFDELTVRKKMRIYELEVQKQNIVNGSYWVSNSCSGDKVEEVV